MKITNLSCPMGTIARKLKSFFSTKVMPRPIPSMPHKFMCYKLMQPNLCKLAINDYIG
jgi:hypothetical protein